MLLPCCVLIKEKGPLKPRIPLLSLWSSGTGTWLRERCNLPQNNFLQICSFIPSALSCTLLRLSFQLWKRLFQNLDTRKFIMRFYRALSISNSKCLASGLLGKVILHRFLDYRHQISPVKRMKCVVCFQNTVIIVKPEMVLHCF